MKKQILFIHSAGPQRPHEGSNDLVAYLQKELNGEYTIKNPNMPDPENPRYQLWKSQIEKEMKEMKGEVILIGHSLGGSVLLKYLSEETCELTIKGLFLVAAAYWGQKDWEIDEYALQKDFTTRLPPIPKTFLYHSRDDEWVPFTHLLIYAERFGYATVRELDGNDHEFGHGLPELIDDIKSLAL